MRSLLFVCTITVIYIFCVEPGLAFTEKLHNVCKYGTFCNYILNGVRQTLYGFFQTDSDSICLQTRIQECSCYEMLILKDSWVPRWPHLDTLDVNILWRQASKAYHPDKLDSQYDGDKSAPFMFLQECRDIVQHPVARNEYRDRLEPALSALGTDDTMESVARNIIYNVNTRFLATFDMSTVYGPGTRKSNDTTSEATEEKLYVFLDNTPTMKGDGIERGKRIFKSLEKRIFASSSNIYLIERNSRKIVDEAVGLNKDNVQELVYDVWTANGADGTGLYLWEYVWYEMRNKESTDCEIVILTDGYNTYRTGHSTTSFQGVDGLTKLMENLKNSGNTLCRTYIYCVSKECKEEVGKTFRDLTIATGGFACDNTHFDDCNEILTSSHGDRVKFAKDFKNDHVDKVKNGEMKALPFVDYQILKGSL